MEKVKKIAILGAGNIGTAIANGLVQSGWIGAESVILTRRNIKALQGMRDAGFSVLQDNKEAVRQSDVLILAVEPRQIDPLLEDISQEFVAEKHLVISVISGVGLQQLSSAIGKNIPVVRAMPNTAIAVRESITTLATNHRASEAMQIAQSIFNTVGTTIVIDEGQMGAATALGACGIAFFLRAIRAASQGGIEIGFHSEEALAIAAQTAKGAASLLLKLKTHPEHEIDKVTTPRGCTIAGLNQMEHEGFSAALIKGITVSAEKASKLYVKN